MGNNLFLKNGTGTVFFSKIGAFKNGKSGTVSLKYKTNLKSFSNSGRWEISSSNFIIILPTPHMGFFPSIDSHSIPILIMQFSHSADIPIPDTL